MPGKFEIYPDKGGKFRFRLKATNGQIVLSSQGYSTKAAAIKGAESVKENSTDPTAFDATTTESGQFRFNIKAKNHQIIGTSQSYTTASARDNGIEAVGRAADGADIVDADS